MIILSESCNRKILVHRDQVLLKSTGLLIFTEQNIEIWNEFGVFEKKQSDTLLNDFFIPQRLDKNRVADKNYLYDLLFGYDKKIGNEIVFKIGSSSIKQDLIGCAGDTIWLNEVKGVNFYQKYIIVVPVQIYFQKELSGFFKYSFISLTSDLNKQISFTINRNSTYYSIYKCIPERLCKKEYLMKLKAQ